MSEKNQMLSTDVALRMVTDRRRRRILRQLADSDGATTLDGLVGAIDTHTSTTEHDRLAVDLHHVHLPMLQDAGLVEYDARHGTVRYQSSDLVEELLDVCSSR